MRAALYIVVGEVSNNRMITPDDRSDEQQFTVSTSDDLHQRHTDHLENQERLTIDFRHHHFTASLLYQFDIIHACTSMHIPSHITMADESLDAASCAVDLLS